MDEGPVPCMDHFLGVGTATRQPKHGSRRRPIATRQRLGGVERFGQSRDSKQPHQTRKLQTYPRSPTRLAGLDSPPRLQMELRTCAARSSAPRSSSCRAVPFPRVLSHRIWSRSGYCTVCFTPSSPVARSRFSTIMTTAHKDPRSS